MLRVPYESGTGLRHIGPTGLDCRYEHLSQQQHTAVFPNVCYVWTEQTPVAVLAEQTRGFICSLGE
jgi:hypothetical protein